MNFNENLNTHCCIQIFFSQQLRKIKVLTSVAYRRFNEHVARLNDACLQFAANNNLIG
jgi:hypothetical protein